MKIVYAILKKDLKSIFTSPMFYVIGALIASILSYSFLRSFFGFIAQSSLSQVYQSSQQNLNLHYAVNFSHISLVNLLLIFAIPALTMKLLSEEKKMGTYDLLLTAPIHSYQIVLGKFLAGFLSSCVWLLLAFSYPLSVLLVSDASFAVLFTSFLSCFFLTAIYIASGLFASSLSSSAVLSVILGFLFNLVLWIAGGAQSAQGAGGGDFMDQLLSQISLSKHFIALVTGNFNINSVVYFISLAVFFLFITERSVESLRWRV